MSRSLLRHTPLIIAVVVLIAPVHDLVNRLRHRRVPSEAPSSAISATAAVPVGKILNTRGEDLQEDITAALPGTIKGVRRSSAGEEIALSATSLEFARLLDRMRSANHLREVRADRSGQEWAVQLSLETGSVGDTRSGTGNPARMYRSTSRRGTRDPGFSVDELAEALSRRTPSLREPAAADSVAITGTSPVSFGMVRFSSGRILRWYRRADLLRLEPAP